MAKVKKNFYAIKIGVDPKTKLSVENLILKSWIEVEPYVKGVSAIYAGFATLLEAEEYLGTKDPLLNISDGLPSKDFLHCYVDGSFNSNIPNYGYGLACIKDDKVIYRSNGIGKNADAISMQQIGGELSGAINALLFARKNGFKKVAIIHDYKGVCYHATGYWKRDNSFSKDYYNWMQDFFKTNTDIEVVFYKVDAHSGYFGNELADGLAKLAVQLEPDSIYYRMINKYERTGEIL